MNCGSIFSKKMLQYGISLRSAAIGVVEETRSLSKNHLGIRTVHRSP